MRNRRRSLAAVLAVGATAAVPALAAEHPLRLDEAVQLIVARNEASHIADEQVAAADAAVQKAFAGFLPTIQGTAAEALSHPNTPSNNATASGSLTQPILNAPVWPLYRQAQRLYDAQKASSKDAKRLLEFTAASAFFQTLSVEQVLQAANRRVDSAKANLVDTQARAKAQLNSTNDVTRAEVNLAAAEQEVALDVGNVQHAYTQLGFVLNTPVDGPLEPPAPTLQAAAVPVGSPDPLIAVADKRRPDLIASEHSAHAAHFFADEPLLRIIPTIGVTGAITATQNPPATGHAVNETLTATATWVLYDAGVRYADKHSRDALANIADLQYSLLERSVANDVRNALVALTAAQAAFRAAADGVRASRKNVEETAILYRQGLGRAIELTDANDSRFEAEVGYASAEFAMAQAYLALRQAMGLEPLGTELR